MSRVVCECTLYLFEVNEFKVVVFFMSLFVSIFVSFPSFSVVARLCEYVEMKNLLVCVSRFFQVHLIAHAPTSVQSLVSLLARSLHTRIILCLFCCSLVLKEKKKRERTIFFIFPTRQAGVAREGRRGSERASSRRAPCPVKQTA